MSDVYFVGLFDGLGVVISKVTGSWGVAGKRVSEYSIGIRFSKHAKSMRKVHERTFFDAHLPPLYTGCQPAGALVQSPGVVADKSIA